MFSWQNFINLCPASFCTPRPNLPVTPGVFLAFYICIPVHYNEKEIFFWVLVLEGLIGLQRTDQLQLLQLKKAQGASQVALVIKNLPANAGDKRDTGSIPALGRSPGEGNGNPLQYSCLENPMDRGTWLAAVQGVTKSQIRLSDLALALICSSILGTY